MKRPKFLSLSTVRNVLEDGQYWQLQQAFYWHDTPQGHEHWQRRQAHGSLTREDRDYLRRLIQTFDKPVKIGQI